ncbi:MAG TPA: AI-2E family transporter [Polyangiaceae bacterium]|jgi:predicted PurR-regulated permease PerM
MRSVARPKKSDAVERSSEPRVVSSPAQQRALGVFAIAAALALILLSLPVASGLFLGTLLAFSLQRVHERLARRLHRRTLSALVLALSSALATVGGLALLLYVVVARGVLVAKEIASGFEPEGPLQKAFARLSSATQNSTFGPIDIGARVRGAAGEAASKLTSAIAAVAGATFSVMLALFFTTMTAFFVLRHWDELLERAERMLPLHPTHTRVVMAEFQIVGKEVFIGTMLAGVVQGVLAGIGYALGGVPEPTLLGALTAICSLLPAIGTALIWVSVGVGLLLTGHPGAGAFELTWGALVVVVLSDYVIRPKLVGRGGHVPTLLTFVAIFGGLEVFGLLGLIVGPVLAAVALAVLRTYYREIREGSA